MQCREHVRDAVDEATSSSQLLCRACCHILDAHAFSSRQRKNQENRRCVDCIAKDAPLRDRDDLEQVAVFGVLAATKGKDGASLSKRLPNTADLLREGRLAPNDAAKAVTHKLMQSAPEFRGIQTAFNKIAPGASKRPAVDRLTTLDRRQTQTPLCTEWLTTLD